MIMIEQNISGVKLEKMRKKAHNRTKMMFRIPKIVFIIALIFSLIQNRYLYIFLFNDYDMQPKSILDSIFKIFNCIILSFFIAAIFFAVLWVAWKKAYDIFNYNYKNKYVLQKIREIPLFSEMKYSSMQGLAFEELLKTNLLPGTSKLSFRVEDYFEGVYNHIYFRSCRVETGDSSVPLFQGQIMIFEGFHTFKKSKSYIQIFSKKESDKMKGQTLPIKVQTENENFNNQFSVFTQEEHNAFYVLTPKVIEDIMEFTKTINSSIYIVFLDNHMYVGCKQMQNPFNAVVDLPIEEQGENIIMTANLIQKARDILIQIESQLSN